MFETPKALTSDDDTAGTPEHNLRVPAPLAKLREVTARLIAEGAEVVVERPTPELRAERARCRYRDHAEEIAAVLDGTHPGFARGSS